jgi:hypothetical protein
MSAKQNMHMIRIVIPFPQGDVVLWRYILEYSAQPLRHCAIHYSSPILHDKDEVIPQCEHRMIIAVHIHMHISPFAFATDYTTIGACAQ